MFKALFLLIIGAVGAIVFLASRKPNRFHIERSIDIDAPPEVVFAYLNDLKAWEQWSPWAKKDPGMQQTYSANTVGVGAFQEWSGNKEVGQGRMQISQSEPAKLLVTDLQFIKPFKAHNAAALHLTPNAGGTHVRWTLEGDSPLISKILDLLMNMDKMIGRDYELGLSQLKLLAESTGKRLEA
jgi:uncharacterized protein YndB with AHSA1/START domain